VAIVGASHVLDEVAQLVTQRGEYLVFVFHGFCVAVSLCARCTGLQAASRAYRPERVSTLLWYALDPVPEQWSTAGEWHSVATGHRRAARSVNNNMWHQGRELSATHLQLVDQHGDRIQLILRAPLLHACSRCSWVLSRGMRTVWPRDGLHMQMGRKECSCAVIKRENRIGCWGGAGSRGLSPIVCVR